MARTIRIGDIGDYANNQMEKLLRAAVLETDSLLKQASPVDTGSVHNNLPYAEKLADGQVGKGGSKQTGGPGWVQGVAKDVQGRVRIAAAKIGRES
jgi:hypothetical protein